jgi:hypothetical protein
MTPPGIRGATATAGEHLTPAHPLKSATPSRKLRGTPAQAGHPSFAERLP